MCQNNQSNYFSYLFSGEEPKSNGCGCQCEQEKIADGLTAARVTVVLLNGKVYSGDCLFKNIEQIVEVVESATQNEFVSVWMDGSLNLFRVDEIESLHINPESSLWDNV